MGELQATWIGDRRLFFWREAGAVRADSLLPGLAEAHAAPARRELAAPGQPLGRRTVEGREVALEHALPALTALDADAPVSDAVRCLALASKLALELAARMRAVPDLVGSQARWVALLTRPEDRSRVDALAAALPVVVRCAPTTPTGPVLLRPAADVVQSYLDAAIDHLYRGRAYPGPGRGWALEFGRALRETDATFSPRDVRWQSVPARLSAWTGRVVAPVPRVSFALELPAGARADRFPLRLRLHAPGNASESVPLSAGWRAGRALRIGGRKLAHPAEAALRGLARAAQLFPPLAASLDGPEPRDLELDATEAWAFLDRGRAALEAAGYLVELPEAFQRAGRSRIRARIRLGLPADGRIDLDGMLSYRWEVTWGDRVLGGDEFASLLAQGRPIVRAGRDWVFLDPTELARLPKDLREEGRMSAPEALRAALSGEHDGVEVVVDERFSLLLDALRDPPALPAPAGLEGTLRPYQARGQAWLVTLGALGLGACLADDMGLGKTVQLVAYLLSRLPDGRRRRLPSLVVCPTSVLGNWHRELQRFAPSIRALRWHGGDRDGESLDRVDVVLTTYGLLARDTDDLADRKWDVVVLDEAQAIKNPDSQRAKVARRLKARHRVALTGTPVENRLQELWSIFDFLVPGLLGKRAAFHRDVAVPVERFGDEEIATTLKLTLSPFLLRRVKTDPNVVDDLPDKLERREYCELTVEQRALYKSEVDAAMEEIRTVSDIERRGRVLAMLTALKQICNHPYHFQKKREAAANPNLEGRSGKLERVSELLEQIADCGERAVLFTQYREMGDLLQKHLSNVLGEPIPFLHGGTAAHHRDEMVRRFQEDRDAPTVLLVSLRAGGTGLNLTRATHVIHYDRWWNPAVEDQATDRAYRIGQHQNVQVYKLVCEGTLEERIDALLTQKRELSDSVVGSGEQWVTELDDDALRRLVLLAGDDDPRPARTTGAREARR